MRPSGAVIAAFTVDQVTRLTGLTRAQLAYWDRTDFFKPQFSAGDEAAPYGRIYSFEDVVALRTLGVLRRIHRVSLPHLREVARELSQKARRPWSDLRLMVVKRKVHFIDPETGGARGVLDGQYALLAIVDVMDDVRREADLLGRRTAAQIGRIEQRRSIAHRAPVIAGTRVPVAAIRRLLDDGYSAAEIVREYPSLTTADVEAAAADPNDRAA